MPKKAYTPLSYEAILCIMALRAMHQVQDQREAEDPDNPLTIAGRCTVNQMHYALQKTAEKRCFDPDQIAELMGGPGTK